MTKRMYKRPRTLTLTVKHVYNCTRLQLQLEAQRNGLPRWWLARCKPLVCTPVLVPSTLLHFLFLLFLSYWKNMFFFTFSWLVPLSLGLFSTEMVLFDHNQGRWMSTRFTCRRKSGGCATNWSSICRNHVCFSCGPILLLLLCQFCDMVIVPLTSLTRIINSFLVRDYLVCMIQKTTSISSHHIYPSTLGFKRMELICL